jgi:hypothetical protein
MEKDREGSDLANQRLRGRAVVGLLLIVVAVWVVAGLVRAPVLAQDYVAHLERPKQLSDGTTTLGPAIPPFWSVRVQATVTEPNGTSYTATQLLWVEPISGLVLTMGAG